MVYIVPSVFSSSVKVESTIIFAFISLVSPTIKRECEDMFSVHEFTCMYKVTILDSACYARKLALKSQCSAAAARLPALIKKLTGITTTEVNIR